MAKIVAILTPAALQRSWTCEAQIPHIISCDRSRNGNREYVGGQGGGIFFNFDLSQKQIEDVNVAILAQGTPLVRASHSGKFFT